MANTATGNRVVLQIKGQTIGVIQNCSFEDDFSLQSVDGLGDVEVVEHVVGAITHRISGEKYMVAADTLLKLQYVPTSAEWLTAPELSVCVIDTVSGVTVEEYSGCKFNTHSRRYTKHQITGESFTILARHKA